MEEGEVEEEKEQNEAEEDVGKEEEEEEEGIRRMRRKLRGRSGNMQYVWKGEERVK